MELYIFLKTMETFCEWLRSYLMRETSRSRGSSRVATGIDRSFVLHASCGATVLQRKRKESRGGIINRRCYAKHHNSSHKDANLYFSCFRGKNTRGEIPLSHTLSWHRASLISGSSSFLFFKAEAQLVATPLFQLSWRLWKRSSGLARLVLAGGEEFRL